MINIVIILFFLGVHKFEEVPQLIAEYLGLEEPHRYTGHCFRRSSATAYANSGGNLTGLKQLGGWKSDSVCQGYVDDTLSNKKQRCELLARACKMPTVKESNSKSTAKPVDTFNESQPIATHHTDTTSNIANSPLAPTLKYNIETRNTSNNLDASSLAKMIHVENCQNVNISVSINNN